MIDEGLTSHQTHYRSHRGRVFTSNSTLHYTSSLCLVDSSVHRLEMIS